MHAATAKGNWAESMAMSNQPLNTIHNGFSVPQSHDHHCTELKRESEITAAKTYVWEPAWSSVCTVTTTTSKCRELQGIAHGAKLSTMLCG